MQATRFGQALNFDFDIRNTGDERLELTEVLLVVRDPDGAVAKRRALDDNGISPGIHTVPRRSVLPASDLTLFNPFHTLSGDLPIGTLEYSFGLPALGLSY
jgi:hypothetical protein